MSDSRRCLDCGAEIPLDAPHGICRKCLIQVGLEDSHHLRIRCPHCHHPVELLADAPLSDVTCPSCDTCFSLVGDETVAMPDAEGDRFGRFSVVATVGRGSFGTVYKAIDPDLDRTVAVKVPRSSQLPAAQTEQFFREARAAARLRHPNIVAIHEVGREDGSVYIVSDYIDGPNLADWLTRQRPTTQESVELCIKITDALQHAHEAGIIHRDLKPSNIMLDVDGEPHLMDFGLAKRQAGEITMTVEGRVLGTPAYMSPEQARGDAHNADQRSDLYSVGVILFELLTGDKPFRGNVRMLLHQVINEEAPSPRKLDGRVPADLETVCLKCLEKDPRRRYASARQLGDELRRYLRGEPIRARRVSSAVRAARWCKRKPEIAALLTALAVVVVAGFAGVTGQWLRAEREAVRATQNADRERRSRKVADAATSRATAEAERNRQLLYVSDMNSALQAWESANVGRMIELLQRHSPQPQQTDLRGFEWHYLMALCEPSRQVQRLDNQGPVFSVAFSADGTQLAAGGFRTIKIWDAASHDLLQQRTPHEKLIGGLAFSPDGRLLASGSHDSTIRLWDTASGDQVSLLKHEQPRPTSRLVFSADSQTLIANGGGVTFWQVASGDPRVVDEQRGVMSLAVSHDGSRFASGDSRGGVKIWDLRSPDQEPTEIAAHEGWVWSLAFSPDGEKLASGSRDYTVKEWSVASGQQLASMHDHQHFVTSVAYSPSGSLLASASWDGTVKLSAPGTGRVLQTLKGHAHWVNSIAFSPDGLTLASGSVDQKVMLWNVTDVDQIENPKGIGASMSADGRIVAAWDRQGQLTFWNRSTGARRRRGRVGGCAALSPDGTRFAAGAEGDKVKIWDMKAGMELASLSGHSPQKFVAFSPDGATIVTGVGEKLKIWNSSTYEEQATVDVSRPSLPVYQYPVAFAPGGDTIATAVEDKTSRNWTIKTWSIADGAPQLTMAGHTTPVAALAFSPSDDVLASASHGGSIRLWDVRSGQPIGVELQGHIGGVYAVTFSPQGDRLVSGGSDGGVKVWDINARTEVITLKAGTSRVFALQFASDGQQLLTANEDETLQLWLAPRLTARPS